MKYAYFNPTIVGMEDVPESVIDWCKLTVDHAHTKTEFNDAGNPGISVRGGQQIQLLPNTFGMSVTPLANYIEEICQEYLDTVKQSAGIAEDLPVKPMLVSAWTIKQSSGDYQALHSHEAHISGNIYIEIPTLETGSANTDCCIEFRLPTVRNPARFVFTDTWRFIPEKGKMIVFPSYLAHTVYPWKGSGNRTILAWDVKLVDR
jgi:hypothetical protein